MTNTFLARYLTENNLYYLPSLEKHCNDNFVKIIMSKKFPDLVMLHYKDECTYENKWPNFARWCRGLIIDLKRKTIVSYPFNKFFLLNQMPETKYDTLKTAGSFEVVEKLDGCLDYKTIILTDIGQICVGKIVNNKLPVKVLSFNHALGLSEFKPIKKYHKYKRKTKLLQIACKRSGVKGNRTGWITCTDNHEFFTKNGYKPAKDLKVGEVVYRTSDKLSEIQKQVIIGGLLGDTGLHKQTTCNGMALSLCQGIKQKDYFFYKAKLLGKLFTQNKTVIGHGYEGSKPRLKGHIKQSIGVNTLMYSIGLSPKSGRKITYKLADSLTPLSLAIWYMDDGCIQYGTGKQRPSALFATNSFSVSELTILQKALKRNFRISSTIYTKKSYKGNVLSFNSDSSEIFFELVAPYMCTTMKYKLPIRYTNYPCIYENVDIPDSTLSIIPTIIIEIKEAVGNDNWSRPVYDLTIPDNHNYFANSILIHNSMIMIFKDPTTGNYKASTKGSFDSDHGAFASTIIPDSLKDDKLHNKYSLMFELIEKKFQIVINYEKKGYKPGLYLIGARVKETGELLSFKDVAELAHTLGVPTLKVYNYKNLNSVIEASKLLPVLEEGYVIRFKSNGQMVKLKGDEYLSAHRFISSLSPKYIIEALGDGVDPQSLIDAAPEEYKEDVEREALAFKEKHRILINHLHDYYTDSDRLEGRKEFAIWVQNNVPSDLRKFLFNLHDKKELNSKKIYETIAKRDGVSGDTKL